MMEMVQNSHYLPVPNNFFVWNSKLSLSLFNISAKGLQKWIAGQKIHWHGDFGISIFIFCNFMCKIGCVLNFFAIAPNLTTDRLRLGLLSLFFTFYFSKKLSVICAWFSYIYGRMGNFLQLFFDLRSCKNAILTQMIFQLSTPSVIFPDFSVMYLQVYALQSC